MSGAEETSLGRANLIHGVLGGGQMGAVLGAAYGGVAAVDWWAGLDVAYQPKGAADLAASLLDLTGNGNNGTDPGGPAQPGWNAGIGWIMGGNDYIITPIIPVSGHSMLIQFNGVVGHAGVVCGTGTSTRGFWMIPSYFTRKRMASGPYSDLVPIATTGNLAVTANGYYLNGAPVGVPSGALGVVAAIYIGARNNGGVAEAFITCNVVAWGEISSTLTDGEVTTYAAAMALV